MPDHVKVYVGKRDANIRAAALKHFPKILSSGKKEGNISAFYNHAANLVYHLDPETGEELGWSTGGASMVADKPQSKSLHDHAHRHKPKK